MTLKGEKVEVGTQVIDPVDTDLPIGVVVAVMKPGESYNMTLSSSRAVESDCLVGHENWPTVIIRWFCYPMVTSWEHTSSWCEEVNYAVDFRINRRYIVKPLSSKERLAKVEALWA